MVETIFEMFTDGISIVEDIWNDIMNGTGMLPIVIGIICIAIFFRLVINPLFAGHLTHLGSDSVSRNYHYEDSNITVKEVR